MIKTQLNTDRIAMTLSFACVIHCFFAPALIIFSYGLLSFSIESELVHYFILFLAVPISSIALMIGYRNHNVLSFLMIGIVGLSVLILAVVLENFIGETGERAMTLLGSSLVAYSHYKNYVTCKNLDCDCHEKIS